MSTAAFADWLRARAEAKGWLQRDLARAAGVSQQTASRWLLGQAQPNVVHAQVLAEVLDVGVDEVLKRLGAGPPAGRADRRDAELAELRARVERLESELARRRRA
ncbi:MAG TPA: helix-turn-helix transcriptional regulator [Acidimicrobiales bacterium]|nr:helix-turn-helix transcriptional regulator [Acidimicrobiales bacterium]